MYPTWLEMTPMGRVGQPEEIASTVLFLASRRLQPAHRQHRAGRRRLHLLVGRHDEARGQGRHRHRRCARHRRRHLPRATPTRVPGSSSPTSLEDEAEALAAEIGRERLRRAARRDASRPRSTRMVETVVASAGGIDILVNNAGIFDMAPILEITEASYDKQFAVNIKGLLFMLQAVARADGRAGPRRQDRQLRQPGRPPRRGAGRGLLRLQGRRDQPHPVRRARPDQARDQRQRHRARA